MYSNTVFINFYHFAAYKSFVSYRIKILKMFKVVSN